METHWGRYRIRSSRRRGWDYGASAWYFVTICVNDRAPCLAKVFDGKAMLTPVGEVVAGCWETVARIRPEVVLGEWVVMPDHFHALIRPSASPPAGHAGPGMPPDLVPAWRPGTLGVIVNHFKRAVTMELRRRNLDWPGWQPRYHDRIVRDQSALAAIGRYIALNPSRFHAGPHRGPADGE